MDDCTHISLLYEGPNLANLESQKVGELGRKLEGSHLQFYYHFDEY